MLANREETPSQVAAGGRGSADWDVFKQMLNSTRVLQSTETKPVHDLLSGYAAARRIDAQDHLTSTVAHHGSRFEKVRQELLDNLQQPDKDLHNAHFGELGMAHLSTLIGTLNEAVGGQPNAYEELHQVRIIGKRLRYSIELFADCFSGLLRERIYPMIEEAQEIRAVTDSHLAVDRLTAIRTHIQTYRPAEWPRFKKGLDALI